MARLLWVLTILGSLFGGLFVFFALTLSNGAPQEAAGAAIGIAFAVIPYCLARAVSELKR